jgi:predicted TIM-barrel fold metal-dependent hydrolase
LLGALRQLGDRARGVAVADPSMPDSMLREFHAAGIRGLRINLETEKMIEPFHPFDDGRALETLSDWVRDAGTMRPILVDNPARLYGFGPAGH